MESLGVVIKPAAAASAHALAPARPLAEPERRSRGRGVARKPPAAQEDEAAQAAADELPARGFSAELAAHLALFQRLGELDGVVAEAAERLGACLSAGGKLLICGNGGCASAAQHMAAELAGDGGRERRPLAALALCADGAALSGSASACGFDKVLARQVQALGRAGDALLLLHAGGAADNLALAAQVARDTGLLTLGLVRSDSGDLLPLCHLAITVPADGDARVEEAQAFIAHALCGLIEARLGLA
ncbi:MAG TPA: SIS domain-containing protein [Ideonella sp.]|nr:SIS domain-containing protein [Ideonella sp.]